MTLCRLTLLAAPWVALTSTQVMAGTLCQPQYRFDIQTQTSFDYIKLQSAPQTSTVHLQGKLSLKAAQKGEEKNWWAIKADQVAAIQGKTQIPLPSYEHAFAFKLTDKGLISDFYFAGELDQQTQDKLKGLAYYLQYQRDISQVSKEPDTLGQYQPAYQQTGKQLKMVKQHYSDFDRTQLATFNRIEVLDSAHLITPSACFIKHREGQEALALTGTDLRFGSQQSYTLTLAPQPFKSTLYELDNDLAAWQTTEAELSDAEKARLAAELNQLITTQDITQIDAHTLSILLQKYNAVIGTLAPLILSGELNDKAQMRLFNALGQLDSDTSQQLLSQLLLAEKQPLTQFRALRALTQGNAPLSQQAADMLLGMLTDGFSTLDSEVESSFYMTLGILLNNRSGSDTATQLSLAITEQITLGESEGKTASLLTALGNSRDPQHEPLLAAHLSDNSARIEKASIRALGMMKTDTAYQNLEQHFFKSPERNKKALLSALGNYQMSAKTSDTVLNMAVSDQDDAVRLAAIKALATQKQKDGIKPILRQALQNETSRRNFKAIIKLLHSKEEKAQ
ncbi:MULTISPECIES: HEAT repeat domain-containing protein [unclassified Pseudoalteromonas]|uniref:HEAT repeat domain-containing protein n=1 Tax=unclassified Pseudoalteromonas TaxID=194690 RepID=UPI002097B8DB|nr:HEAT repeat domain-containing protein [Pseudoalteromonas sp. XMcav2-N]MCO7189145.1 HEAT repeat domain-containing protein [Pseudoalteromonas sp. XMcav2-N]